VICKGANDGSAAGRAALGTEPGFDPSKPLGNAKHERFCYAIVQGHRLGPAYEIAGFTGKSARLPWQLRHQPGVDARIKWLLEERIRADVAVRARAVEKEENARLRLIRELEAIAYVDPGDLFQWDRKPEFDVDGNLTGYRDELALTPSHLLTKAQRSAVKEVSRIVKKDGTTVRLNTNGKLEALALLARILGMTQPDAPATSSTTINNTQVNVGSPGDMNAFEMARRLAFALEKAARALPAATAELDGPILEAVETHAPSETERLA